MPKNANVICEGSLRKKYDWNLRFMTHSGIVFFLLMASPLNGRKTMRHLSLVVVRDISYFWLKTMVIVNIT